MVTTETKTERETETGTDRGRGRDREKETDRQRQRQSHLAETTDRCPRKRAHGTGSRRALRTGVGGAHERLPRNWFWRCPWNCFGRCPRDGAQECFSNVSLLKVSRAPSLGHHQNLLPRALSKLFTLRASRRGHMRLRGSEASRTGGEDIERN